MRTVSLAAVATALALCTPASAQCWSTNFSDPFSGGRGVDLDVFAFQSFDDGSGPKLYVGGFLTLVGDGGPGLAVNYAARWDGAAWSDVGGGFDDYVTCFAVWDDGSGPALYAGGAFSAASFAPARGVAKWNGTSWSDVGGGLNGGALVYSLEVFDDGSGPALYAIGDFNQAGAATVSNIARWDGTAWSDVGGGLNDTGYALHVHDDGTGPALFAGGDFLSAGGVATNRIAKWNGSAWSALGGGLGGSPFPFASALATWDDGAGPRLVVGGDFLDAGGVSVGHIATWDGASWAPLGSGATGHPFNYVGQLLVHDDGQGPALYAGGLFTAMDGVNANFVARRSAGAWSELDFGIDGTSFPAVWALGSHDDGAGPALWVGGSFEFVGGAGVQQSYLASWRTGACGLGTVACSGDGSGAACPCANLGASGAGCANSVSASGARLSAASFDGTASVSADTLRFDVSGLPNSTSALLFQGTQLLGGVNGVPFGDGLRCTGGATQRLIVRSASGATSFGAGFAGDPALSALGGVTASGGTRVYQVWYRDNAANFCTAARSNLSNAVQLNWIP